ncbi:MAG TPA: S8 family serine peptidase, partial [Capillimicrobium sp.]|nr:S8 family serine peptidase [Capillimicrobium sp.]
AMMAASLAAPGAALADGAGSPQAIAARAEFLSSTPAPPGGAGAVCVIDSGVDTDTDLGPALVERGSVPPGGPVGDLGARSDTGITLAKHGTYVAGVIASQVDGVGASGIWPASRVLSSRIFDGRAGAPADYLLAIGWCQESVRQTKVINISIAGLALTAIESNQLRARISQARANGINVVAAAGNSGIDDLAFPAAFPGVFAVGATDGNGVLAPFSNRGPELDIATFGTDVCLTTASGHRIGVGTGTSYAAPVVSAALNALRSYKPELTPDAAEQALISSARIVNGVRVLDVAQTFIDQGLGALVAAGANADAAPCEAVVTGSSAGAGAGGAAGGVTAVRDEPAEPELVLVPSPPVAAPMVSVALPDGDERTADVPDRPALKHITFRRGRLRVAISGRRTGDVVTFTVDRRRFVRRASRLDVRVRRWRTVTVRLRRPDAGTSPALVIRRGHEFS